MRGARQINPKGSSLPEFTVNRNGPAALLGKPVNHAQSEAGALAHPLRGKERLKGASADLLAHAGSCVSHGDRHIITWIDVIGPIRQLASRRLVVPRIDF